jgi:acetolactate synthase regulatory subunit
MSQVTQDHLNLHKKPRPTHRSKFIEVFNATLESAENERKAKIAASIPDYKVPMMDQARIVKVNFEDHANSTHPLEVGAQERRASAEYKGKVTPNQLLLFNIPTSQTEEKIRNLISVKGVVIEDLEIKKAIDGHQIAHVKVTLQNPRQVKTLKNELYNIWIEDKKLKAKDHTDLEYETYNNRTIVARNLPIHYKI